MRGNEQQEVSWDLGVAALPFAGWLGPIGRAWWLGAEPERRPHAGGRPRREGDHTRAVRTIFDDLVHRRSPDERPRRPS